MLRYIARDQNQLGQRGCKTMIGRRVKGESVKELEAGCGGLVSEGRKEVWLDSRQDSVVSLRRLAKEKVLVERFLLPKRFQRLDKE